MGGVPGGHRSGELPHGSAVGRTSMKRVLLFTVLLPALLALGCQRQQASARLREDQSFAELRAIKGTVLVTAPDRAARRPYPRERLVNDERVEVKAGALIWMRRDGGATWLVSGPALLDFQAEVVELTSGRAFVDSERG